MVRGYGGCGSGEKLKSREILKEEIDRRGEMINTRGNVIVGYPVTGRRDKRGIGEEEMIWEEDMEVAEERREVKK